jgi:hypothetical protein
MAKPGPSTRQYLDIAEIKEDVVIMKDGTLRVVLLASSINFSLKSDEEQDAIVASYVQFLNSIDFNLQIVIQSRPLNIEKYLNKLQSEEKEQKNELLKIQIADYRQFIGELIQLADIMSKKFYVVVPYNFYSSKGKNFFTRMKEVFLPASAVRIKKEIFMQRKRDLMLRVENVASGLRSMGVNAVPLDTQGLIELYYNAYNPEKADTQKMVAVDSLKVEAN